MRGFLWLLALFLAAPARILAHCDGMDGPVVKAAQKALEASDAASVLMWVQERDEPEIRAAFAKTLEVRKLGGAAQELADRWFFETLVRVHRAGEGAPYSGLQPAGRDLGPAIPAADRAVETGSPEALEKLLLQAVHTGLERRLHEVRRKTGAGRAWVKAYVEFAHWAESVHQAAQGPSDGHAHESH
jgi:hypothetical protein